MIKIKRNRKDQEIKIKKVDYSFVCAHLFAVKQCENNMSKNKEEKRAKK